MVLSGELVKCQPRMSGVVGTDGPVWAGGKSSPAA